MSLEDKGTTALVPYEPEKHEPEDMPVHPQATNNEAINDLDAEEVGKVVVKLQEEIQIIKLQLENLPGYDKGK